MRHLKEIADLVTGRIDQIVGGKPSPDTVIQKKFSQVGNNFQAALEVKDQLHLSKDEIWEILSNGPSFQDQRATHPGSESNALEWAKVVKLVARFRELGGTDEEVEKALNRSKK